MKKFLFTILIIIATFTITCYMISSNLHLSPLKSGNCINGHCIGDEVIIKINKKVVTFLVTTDGNHQLQLNTPLPTIMI